MLHNYGRSAFLSIEDFNWFDSNITDYWENPREGFGYGPFDIPVHVKNKIKNKYLKLIPLLNQINAIQDLDNPSDNDLQNLEKAYHLIFKIFTIINDEELFSSTTHVKPLLKDLVQFADKNVQFLSACRLKGFSENFYNDWGKNEKLSSFLERKKKSHKRMHVAATLALKGLIGLSIVGIVLTSFTIILPLLLFAGLAKNVQSLEQRKKDYKTKKEFFESFSSFASAVKTVSGATKDPSAANITKTKFETQRKACFDEAKKLCATLSVFNEQLKKGVGAETNSKKTSRHH